MRTRSSRTRNRGEHRCFTALLDFGGQHKFDVSIYCCSRSDCHSHSWRCSRSERIDSPRSFLYCDWWSGRLSHHRFFNPTHSAKLIDRIFGVPLFLNVFTILFGVALAYFDLQFFTMFSVAMVFVVLHEYGYFSVIFYDIACKVLYAYWLCACCLPWSVWSGVV